MGPSVPIRVLIVEDEAAIRRFIRLTLDAAGYETLEAENGVAARTVLQSHDGNVGLVILDIVMPGGNGLDFANQLAIERPGTAILYISGYPESVAVTSIARIQPHGILTKPFSREQLLDRVREATSG